MLNLSVVRNDAYFNWGGYYIRRHIWSWSDGLRYVIIGGDKVYLKGLN